MKNCNCKDKEVTPCNDKCVIRQMIDECSGNKINYITLASAVLMGCNDTETVEDVLNEIQRKLNQIDNHIDEYTWDAIIAFLKNNLTRLEPELTNLINSRVENYFLHNDFAGLKQLFRQLFAEWETTFTNLINRIGQGISREELDSILNTRLAPYYTKAEIDTLLSNLGGVKGVAINGASHAPNDNGLVNLGTGFLKSENLDSTPTSGSSNPVTSNGIYNALANKQDKINDLATIRNNATNAVKDVKLAIDGSSIVTNNVATIPAYGLATALFKGANTDNDENVNFYVKANDINDDGVWDILDINIIIGIVTRSEYQEYKSKADLNNDNNVDIADINLCIDHVLGKVEEGPFIAYSDKNYTNPIKLLLNHVYFNKNIQDLFQVVRIEGNQFWIKYLHVNSDVEKKQVAEYSMNVELAQFEDDGYDTVNAIGSYSQFLKLSQNENTNTIRFLEGQTIYESQTTVDSNGTISATFENNEDQMCYFIWEKDHKPIVTTIPIILNGLYSGIKVNLDKDRQIFVHDIKEQISDNILIDGLNIQQDGSNIELLKDENDRILIPPKFLSDVSPINVVPSYINDCFNINDEPQVCSS